MNELEAPEAKNYIHEREEPQDTNRAIQVQYNGRTDEYNKRGRGVEVARRAVRVGRARWRGGGLHATVHVDLTLRCRTQTQRANYRNASMSSFLADRRRCRLFSNSLRRSTISSGSLRSLLQRSNAVGPLIASPSRSVVPRSTITPRSNVRSMPMGTLSMKRL